VTKPRSLLPRTRRSDYVSNRNKSPGVLFADQNGQMLTLEEYKGKKVILFFNPMDNTPGCTKQACNFKELYPQFQEKGAVVIGVSMEIFVASHKKFEETMDSHLHCFLLDLSCIRDMMYGRKKELR
jgi:peroxiredoxin Q/BCP